MLHNRTVTITITCRHLRASCVYAEIPRDVSLVCKSRLINFEPMTYNIANINA